MSNTTSGCIPLVVVIVISVCRHVLLLASFALGIDAPLRIGFFVGSRTAFPIGEGVALR